MQLPKVFALLGTALTGLCACAENNTSLFVAGVLKGDPPECVYKSDPGATQLLSGTMDVGFTRSYSAVVLVANQLSPRGNKSQLRTETMGFQIRGGEIRLTDSTGGLIKEFSTPSSGHSFPTSSNTPGYAVTQLTLIPADVGADFAAQLDPGSRRTVVADIRVFGNTEGGAEITSGSTSFDIEVCHNCLRTYVEGGLSVGDDGYLYCNRAVTEDLIGGCNTGQDAPMDCRLCETEACRNQPF
jgi:hypothetical protein